MGERREAKGEGRRGKEKRSKGKKEKYRELKMPGESEEVMIQEQQFIL